MSSTLCEETAAVLEHGAEEAQSRAMTGTLPIRTADPEVAAALLARNGCALLTGRGTDAGAAQAVAGDVLGELLALPDASAVREGGEGDRGLVGATEEMGVHADGFAYGDRHPDALFLLCARQSEEGGQSMLVDGQGVLQQLAHIDPELHRFLHEVPVDHTEPDMHAACSPIVLRLPSGRCAIRRSPYLRPAADSVDPDRDATMIGRWSDLLGALGTVAPRFTLHPGEVLCIDNYRMLHGRGPFAGERVLWRIWAWTPESNGLPSGALHSDSRYAARSA
jgi:gamma-butyrobetaine dioxygenase